MVVTDTDPVALLPVEVEVVLTATVFVEVECTTFEVEEDGLLLFLFILLRIRFVVGTESSVVVSLITGAAGTSVREFVSTSDVFFASSSSLLA